MVKRAKIGTKTSVWWRIGRQVGNVEEGVGVQAECKQGSEK